MKSNPFRVGNLVNVNGKLLPVAMVDHNSVTVYDDGVGKLFPISEDIFIELTPEILPIFGFKASYDNFYEDEEMILRINLKEESLMACGDWLPSEFPNYAHNLQNLYFELTHKELPINI